MLEDTLSEAPESEDFVQERAIFLAELQDDAPREGGDPLIYLNEHLGFEVGRPDLGSSLEEEHKDKLWAFGASAGAGTTERAAQRARHKRAALARWPRWRCLCLRARCSKVFKALSILFIINNAVVLSLIASNAPGEAVGAQVSLHVCTVFFGIELFIRCASSLNNPWWKSGWLLFDGSIFCSTMAELIIAPMLDSTPTLLPALQVLRLLRLLRILRRAAFLNRILVILRTISQVWATLVAVAIFVGTIWMTMAIFFTASLRDDQDDLSAELTRVAEEYFSSIPSTMSMMLQTTFGGLSWGQFIVDPMLNSYSIRWKLGGMAVLASSLFSVFYIMNLVLGIYLRQVLIIARKHDTDLEHQALLDTQQQVQLIKDILEAQDTDGDGFISREELKRGITDNWQALLLLDLGADEVALLFTALDAADTGNVLICEFLFGVLKLSNFTNRGSVDLLSIDYRQKTFIRDIAVVERAAAKQAEHLDSAFDEVLAAVLHIEKDVAHVKHELANAKSDLLKELGFEEKLARKAHRQSDDEAQLLEQQYLAQSFEERYILEAHLESLQVQVDELTRARQMDSACSGAAGDTVALRRAVRERLDKELKPWLERELRRDGIC